MDERGVLGTYPIARGASACHIVLPNPEGEGTMVAACGIACGSFCGVANYEEGLTHCPEHGEELCPECCDITDSFIWQEGK